MLKCNNSGGIKLISIIKDCFEKRKTIWSLGLSDFKKRFVGAYFGVFWMFVQPIVTVIIYYVVFQLGFKSQPPSTINAPYVLWLIPGIVPWFFLSEAINSGTGCLYDYNFMVKKLVFKVSIVTVIKAMSCLLVHLIFAFIMFVVFVLYGYSPSIYWIQTIYYTFCATVLICGLTFMTSAINVFFKDMGQIVNIIMQFGMWFTPIMWHYSMLGDLSKYLKLNPFYYITEGYRDCMLNHVWFFERPGITIYFWVVTIIIFAIGAAIFKKMQPHFADVL